MQPIDNNIKGGKMYNSVMLIGRTTDKPTIRKLESGVVVGNFVLAVSRPFKNSDGEYDVDFIPCTLWNANAVNANEFCNKGSTVAVRGYLQMKDDNVNINTESGEVVKKTIKVIDIVVEKLIFLKL